MSMDDETVCECGVPLDIHPDLPKPGPLRSWMASRPLKVPFGTVSGRVWSAAQQAGHDRYANQPRKPAAQQPTARRRR